MKKVKSRRTMWNNIKQNGILVTKVPKRGKSEWNRNNIWSNKDWKIFKISLRKGKQQAYRSRNSSASQAKRNKVTLMHILVRLLKSEEKKKTLKAAKRWSESVESRKQWNVIFQLLKEKTVNKEFYVEQNQSSKMKVEWKHFQMNRLEKFIHMTTVLQKNTRNGFGGREMIMVIHNYRME